MKNHVQPGNVVTLIAPYDVASGGGLLVGNIFGVAAYDALSSAEVETAIVGAYSLAKTSAQAWATIGLPIYWDNSAKVATTVATGNKLIGVNLATAANPSAAGVVLLTQPFALSSAAQVTAEIAA